MLQESLRAALLLIILIFLNATFASAEIAVISVSDAKLQAMADDGNKKAKKLRKLTAQPARFLATIQVAITLAGLLQSAFAADTFAKPLVDAMIRGGVTIPENVLNTVTIILITLVLAYFNLVFGELVPKRVAMKRAEKMALGMSGMLYGVSVAFTPLVWLLTVSTNGVLRLLGINPNEREDTVTEEEIRMMLMEGKKQGVIQEDENEMILNVFEFNDITIDEICNHRRNVVTLDMDDPEEVWDQIIFENPHSYYPIFEGREDNITLILDSRYYFRLADKSRESVLKHAVAEPFFVPETMKANALFRSMKENQEYFAVVIDEYGGFSGIITLRDLIEALVGDLKEKEDEDETDTEILEQGEDGTWTIGGGASVSDVAEALHIDLPDEDCTTFGGYICSIINRLPDDGETFTCETDDLIIDVREVRDRTIVLTTVTVKQHETEESEEDGKPEDGRDADDKPEGETKDGE